MFPGDAELIAVPQCTTGRVVMLQFKSSSQKLFYWLQEASTARDQIILQHVNSLIYSQEDDEEEFMDDDAAMEDVEGTDRRSFEAGVWIRTVTGHRQLIGVGN